MTHRGRVALLGCLLSLLLPVVAALEAGEEEGVASSLLPPRRALDVEQEAFARSALELARALKMQGRWDEAVNLLRSSREALEGVGTSTVQLDILLADLLWKRGDLPEAEGLLRQAVAETSAEEDPTVAADALYHLGEVAYVKALAIGDSDFEEATQLHRRALEIRSLHGDLAGVSWSLSRLGTIEELSGADEQALDRFRRALDASSRSGDERGSIRPLTHIGGYHGRRAEWDKALELHRQALGISRRLGDWESLVFGLCNVGEVIARAGDLEEAAMHFEEALAASEEMGFVLAIVRASMGSGELYAGGGDIEKARTEFSRAEAEAVVAAYERLAAAIRERLTQLVAADPE